MGVFQFRDLKRTGRTNNGQQLHYSSRLAAFTLSARALVPAYPAENSVALRHRVLQVPFSARVQGRDTRTRVLRLNSDVST